MPASFPAKRVWRRVEEPERLKLKKIVDMGLSIDLAAKILKMNSRNANRVMTKIRQAKLLEKQPIYYQSKEQRDQNQRAELDSIMEVI